MFDLIPFVYADSPLSRLFGSLDEEPAPCRTDIRDAGDHYELEAELPGFSKEEIHVDIQDDCMTLSAAHKAQKDQKDDKGRYIRRECLHTSMSRAFDVSGVDTDHISASFADGVLRMRLPKKEASKPLPQEIAIQ